MEIFFGKILTDMENLSNRIIPARLLANYCIIFPFGMRRVNSVSEVIIEIRLPK